MTLVLPVNHARSSAEPTRDVRPAQATEDPAPRPKPCLVETPRRDPPSRPEPGPTVPDPERARAAHARALADEAATRARLGLAPCGERRTEDVAPPRPREEITPAALAEKSEALAKLDRRVKDASGEVRSLEEKLADKERKAAEKRAKGAPRQAEKVNTEREKIAAKLAEAKRSLASVEAEAKAARKELEGSTLLAPDTDRGAPGDAETYRRQLAARLGVPEREVSPELARFAREEEAKVVAKATAPFEKFLPSGAVTSRKEARRYFDQIRGNISELLAAKKSEDARRKSWSREHGEPWALPELPANAVLSGSGPDSPVVRWGTAKSEKAIAPVVSDLAYRLRSTALSAMMPENDGSERPLADVFDDVRYAQALGQKTIDVVSDEARARFYEVLRANKGTIELGLGAKTRYDDARSGLSRLWGTVTGARE